MAIEDLRSQAYYTLFKNQVGGTLPTFQGARRYQYGQGFGDIFGGIMRTVLPVVLSGARAFLGAMAGADPSRASLKNALKASIMPAATAALDSEAEQLSKTTKQRGSGHRKRRIYKSSRRRKRRNSNKKQKVSLSNYNF